MALSFTRLDGRLLLLHLLALPCFILGGQSLERVRWVPLFELFQAGGIDAVHRRNPADFYVTMSALTLGPLYAMALAIVGACVLSGVVTWRRGASGLIPLLVLGVAILTARTGFYKSAPVYQALAFLRGLLQPFCSWKAQLGVVGAILVLLGLMPFLLTWRKSPVCPATAQQTSPDSEWA